MCDTDRWIIPFFAAAWICLATSMSRAAEDSRLNLAPAALVSTSFVSGHESLTAVNDGFEPKNSADHTHGCYGDWPQHGTQWVQYEWDREVTVNGSAVYWWDDHQGVRLPKAGRVLVWDGSAFVPAGEPVAVKPDQYNVVDFKPVKTTKVRLEIDAAEGFSSGVIEWKVFDSGQSPPFPPVAKAGEDRVVVLPAVTYLNGRGKGIAKAGEIGTGAWAKSAGPGQVTFEHAEASQTSAAFSSPGEYDLSYTYTLRGMSATDTLHVRAESRPVVKNLTTVYPSHYSVDSPFWKPRLKNQTINWIPHCVAELEKPDLLEGGMTNLIEAGKRLRGELAKPHFGPPWANAYILNTCESMCVALTIDPNGDAELAEGQARLRATLDRWIPIILAAQEPDGYFQTRFTLGTAAERAAKRSAKHWDPRTRGDHEGYVGGYFIEMGIAHYVATEGKDRRLFDAAIRLADCWCDHIGPGKQKWFDGHQEIEQALVRLGRFVNDQDGTGKGQKYIDLAKFLLDCREGGQEYDQSYAPLTHQYRAVGHAVRAAYTYSAMADISMETGDPAYWSATLSIWDNLVNRKLYVTGGIGSGETSEGFGGDYSLPNASAYCESCSSCGLLFMQHKLNLAARDAKYADVYETTLYNAILGDVDLPAKNFTYTNSLDSDEKRYLWHGCPCCVGNIPRVMLMLPTWTYAKSDADLFVNLFIGGTVPVGKVGGVDVTMTQATNYPWDGKVAITVNPATAAKFAVHVRAPHRAMSTLYTLTPDSDGIIAMTVNGRPVPVTAVDGYVTIDRPWQPGDRIEFELPLKPQWVTASDKVASTRGRVAIQRGPIVYNLESVDQSVDKKVSREAGLTERWSPQTLGGVVELHGRFDDGSPMLAIPNYARLNRGGRSLVWMK